MTSKVIQSHFQLLESQRNIFFEKINIVKNPWERPLPDKWSVAETIYHLMLLARLVRRVSIFYLPLMLPYAHLRKTRPYETEIYNIYQKYNQTKKHAMKAPLVLTPPKNLSQKYQFEDIQRLLSAETAGLKVILSKYDEKVAGQIRYPDPIAHYPNVIQSVHLLAIHVQHHFNLLEKYMQL